LQGLRQNQERVERLERVIEEFVPVWSLAPIRIHKSRYLNNRIEQDHRCIKRRIRSMLGFKSEATAEIVLSGIETIHMMPKRQVRYAYNPSLSIAEQFDILAA
jgi:putative transposase